MAVKNGAEKGPVAKQTNWNLVENRLREERQRKLPLTNTSEAIQRFRLSWEVAQKVGFNPRTTGLVEQQACFASLRKLRS